MSQPKINVEQALRSLTSYALNATQVEDNESRTRKILEVYTALILEYNREH